mgnify:CR=1 FL=1
MTNLWGGRFEAAASDLLRRFNDSFDFDRELFAADVRGSIAWAQALERASALSADEAKKIVDGLTAIRASGRAGQGGSGGLCFTPPRAPGARRHAAPTQKR